MIDIYTDGSCKGNPGFGGWSAIIIRDRDKKITISGNTGKKKVTNNQMELYAVIRALKHLYKNGIKDDQIIIYSDSAYVVNNISRMYIWEKNKFEGIRNRKMWKKLVEITDLVPASFCLVKGHDGNEFNEVADKEAQRQAFEAKRR
jgi:ribonuclease HI